MRPSIFTLAAVISVGFTPLSPAENQLAGEKSAHLQRHADSPVDWYPWGEAAFQKARAEEKPIFLSIGYDSCHWCQKMLEESFQDVTTAELLNKNFVNIKVDRAELPEVDRFYIRYLQSSNQTAGWPLNVWMTPEMIPFSAGTYYPKTASATLPSFETINTHIIKQWNQHPDYVKQQSLLNLAQLRASLQDLPSANHLAGSGARKLLLTGYERLSSQFDPENGGFGPAPRFPFAVRLESAYLTLINEEDRNSFRANRCLKMIKSTLDGIVDGAIHDHLGGGIHRYSKDLGWTMPKHEKMLSDQAVFIQSCLTGYLATSDSSYLEVVHSTAQYVQNTLAAPAGGYYYSQHSDSPSPTTGKLESGAYYTWQYADFMRAAGKDAELLASHFTVRPEGNATFEFVTPSVTDNHLRIEQPIAETAKKFGISAAQGTTAVKRGKTALLQARDQRKPPRVSRDVIVSDNAIFASSLAKASIITDRANYLQSATDILTLIREKAFDASSGELTHSIGSSRKGIAQDYAFTIRACLDLYSAGMDQQWLLLADRLQKTQLEKFYDTRNGGFYNTSRNRTEILVRLKSFEAGATPSANPTSILNLVQLGYLFGDADYLRRAKQSFDYFIGAIERSRTDISTIILARQLLETPPAQIIIAGKTADPATKALIATARKHPSQYQLLVQLDPSRENPIISRQVKFAGFKELAGKPTAYLCLDFTCKEPTNSPARLQSQLGDH